MPANATKKTTLERCRSLWERMYPDIKKPETYFRGWNAESAAEGSGPTLDAGCGSGGSVDFKAVPGAGFSVGMDIDLEALKRNPNALFKVAGSMDALPFKDGTFGVITSQYALEHLERPRESFAEIARATKTGGAFIFMTTNSGGYLGTMIRLIPNSIQFVIKRRVLKMSESEIYPVYMRCNTRKKLIRALHEAGFGAPEFVFIGGPFYFGFSYAVFRLAVLFERLTDGGLKHLKFYIVGRAKRR
ncbi:MAG: class I SAM-dependent methyltransferase [bacterium]